MAKVLKTYDFVNTSTAKYPWAEWMDGRIWQLVKGEDFQCSTEAMRQQFHKRGHVRTNVLKPPAVPAETLIIQVKRGKDGNGR